jgi:hypothetical protein
MLKIVEGFWVIGALNDHLILPLASEPVEFPSKFRPG